MKSRTNLKIKILLIEDSGFHLLIKARVNGRVATLLVDTGASRTVFDRNRMSRFTGENKFNPVEQRSTGLGTTEMETQSTVLKKVRLGDLELFDLEIMVIDLSHVNETYSFLKLPAIDGVLGSDLLEKYKAVIDYQKKELRLRWQP